MNLILLPGRKCIAVAIGGVSDARCIVKCIIATMRRARRFAFSFRRVSTPRLRVHSRIDQIISTAAVTIERLI